MNMLINRITTWFRRSVVNALDRRFVRRHRNYELLKVNEERRKAIRINTSLSQEDKTRIDGLYGLSYGEKIPYEWHTLYTAYTGDFDVNYVPELLYIPEFEHFQNPYENYRTVYEDKNVLALIAKGLGVEFANTICSRQAGLYRDRNYNLCCLSDVIQSIKSAKEVFVKPTIESGSGKGCTLINAGGGVLLMKKYQTYYKPWEMILLFRKDSIAMNR